MPAGGDPIKSLLVVGGARSGKSRFAQRMAEASGRSLVLIATAQPLDAEMADRISRHAADRDARWTLIEAFFDLGQTLRREAQPERLLVVDCVTLWLSNLLLRGDDLSPPIKDLARTAARLEGPVIFVSNEVGAGIVPDNALARAFRDAQGMCNQRLAEACDAVTLVTAGIATQIKPGPEPVFRF
ncbi:bifunctional adenosylcobinamide kinase/adenosylcobinamide-phosphate guanylyltransferase [Methylocapsa palsarum]|uniref:Bifunctional adenosylcobalamin biosynthesis protein n=2 Tax=Methylocapsa palsarum TaxID=1612308 RepID=A0A1I3YTB1_9HYPH|nr:bifunctional adenosylcobinamide kinase/adenosylcobinamide-phosphate guanylyltransferase [Methylocapsa palsarum]SFK35055.1 adenosylcobinamide kinase / adenosylcobinamide-phosphate guanylyltransferase [Methylocapsa palsarum]